jgi:hypothetical protein
MFLIHFTILSNNKQVERKKLDVQQKREQIKRSAAQEEDIDALENKYF